MAQGNDKDPKIIRVMDFLDRHSKKILIAETVVIGAVLVRPKVTIEIIRYRQLQQEAAEARMILGEMSYTMDEMAKTLVEIAEK